MKSDSDIQTSFRADILSQGEMRNLRHIILAAILVSFGTIAADSAWAKPGKHKNYQPNISHSYLPYERQSVPKWAERKVSYSEAKAIARARVPGAKVVDIDLRGDVYRVRLKRDGRIMDVYIDANTGRVR